VRKRKNKNGSMFNNPIDSMINKILRTNSPIFYNRLMVNFWDNHNEHEVLQSMVERVYMSSSIICNRSSITAIKLLTLLHRLFLQTPQEFMSVSIVESKFFVQLTEFWSKDSSQDLMKDLVVQYAKFMTLRLKFHSKNPMFESSFSLSLFMYRHQRKDYASFDADAWFEGISQSVVDLTDFGTNHCQLINAILSHKGFNTSAAAQYANAIDVGNILNHCLVPLVEDLHSLYLITTWIIGLLRISFGKRKIALYSEKYKDFMISLIAVISRMQNTAKIVWNSIDIDTKQFPRTVPKISSIALLDLYPPSSFAPNLSAFNRELTNYFVTVIHQRRKSTKSIEHKKEGQQKRSRKSLIERGSGAVPPLHLHPGDLGGGRGGETAFVTASGSASSSECEGGGSTEDDDDGGGGRLLDDDSINHLTLKRAHTHQASADVALSSRRRVTCGHQRAQSTMNHLSAHRTPSPQHPVNHSSSPNALSLFPDLDDENPTPTPQRGDKQSSNTADDGVIAVAVDLTESEEEEEVAVGMIEEEEELKEDMLFAPLSRSISSETNQNPKTPTNPFATSMSHRESGAVPLFPSGGAHPIDNEEDIFLFGSHRRSIFEHQEHDAFDSDSHSSRDFEDDDDDHRHSDGRGGWNEEEEEKRLDVVRADELKWEDLVISERIGIGGFAEVFSGKMAGGDEEEDEFSDEAEQKVAIKKLINQNLTTHNLAEFQSEIDIMRRIKHPNVCRFIGACTISPHMCIVTELLEMSLFDLLHNTRIRLATDIEVKVAEGATKGVAHLHEHNIIHRDLKSANILLDRHYEPRITDFGLSRMKDQSTLTAGTGTFQWMAPEVIQGRKYDERSDIYSLAIIFWEIKTGLIPFASYRLNGIQASVAVVTQKKRPRIDVSIFKTKANYAEWSRLIVKMWNQSARQRPTANEVVNVLSTF